MYTRIKRWNMAEYVKGVCVKFEYFKVRDVDC